MEQNFNRKSNVHSTFPEKRSGSQLKKPSPMLENLDPKQFELLSAYLDNEATPEERRQVQLWLDTDKTIKNTYLQLIQLRSQLQNAPVPKSEQSVQDLATRIFQRLNQRTRRMAVWGGTAIAAVVLMAVSGIVSGNSGRVPLFAQSEPDKTSEPLEIALNEPLIPIVNPNEVSISVDQPIIPIPKTAVSTPTD